ncbi:MAG: winged helix-turn-helix transcriptional regulator [Nitrososphaeraceae archaeon]|nr:winged helix-turn-helix transcriptional regulator [Nitrososphaeraceae archaeon]
MMKTESTTTTTALNYGDLNDTQRDKLLRYINGNPGIRYRELLRLSNLTNGVLTYHLALLEKSDRIQVDRNENKKMTRYYPNNIPIQETNIIGYIRQDATRQIVLFILQNDLCTFDKIVEHTKKAPSTISWHLKRLKEAGIISVQHGRYLLYHVTDREMVAEVLRKYKQRFIDKVVDRYTEAIEEL